MHGVREEILRAQADAAGLPLLTIPLPWPCTNEIYEARLRTAVDRAVADGFTHVAFGDLFLEDVRRYREERLAGTGLTPLFPLWGMPTPGLAREMIAGGIRARISTLDPRVMPRELAGAAFDEALLAALPRMPPTAGIALGFDRLVMLVLGARDIGEVVAFGDDRNG